MPPSAVARRCRRTAYTALLGLAVAAPGSASAATVPTGGTVADSPAPPAPAVKAPPAPSLTANLYGRPAPRISRVVCRTACSAAGAVRPGALVRVYGRNLRKVDEVILLGAAGEADDTSVARRSAGKRSLLARVPRTAASGPLALALADGTRSPASKLPLAVEPPPTSLPAGAIDAEAQGHKVFFGAQRQAELSYVVGGAQPASVQIELVRGGDGSPVASWSRDDVAPGVPQTVRWNGMAAAKVAPDGVYQFRVTATDATGVRATSSQSIASDPAAPGAFRFVGYRFPVVGAHGYGGAVGRFGGGRGHQGQDVFAACGTPLVAARGGVVKAKQYHARAGYYLVIDGARTGVDFAYMHLREPALVDVGKRVKTGQLIGYVGDTGDADGCHLHLEEWTAPGWYSGGSAFDPLPDLRAWDALS